MLTRTAERPALTVIVPSRDRPRLLADCLASLRRDLRPQDQLIVVDSASRGSATSAVAQSYGAEVVRLAAPGASRARNAGAQAARNPLVAFTDDDCQVEQGWADAMVLALAAPGRALVTGRIDLPESQQDFPAPLSVLAVGEPLLLDPHQTPMGASANLGVHGAALRRVGGFDERLGPGTPLHAGEDCDLIARLLRAGFAGAYCPDVRVTHTQWRSGKAALRVQYGYGKGAGALLAQAMWQDRPRARRMAPAVVRLGGVRTLRADVVAGRRRSYLPGICWRLGAVAGFASGLWSLRTEPAEVVQLQTPRRPTAADGAHGHDRAGESTSLVTGP